MNTSLAELQTKALNKVNETVAKIEQLYGTKFQKPVTVSFDINSARLAGEATPAQFKVRLNPAFLLKYKELYINRTVVHEVAHLGVQQVFRLDKKRSDVTAHGSE